MNSEKKMRVMRDERFLDYYQRCKEQGMNEAEIAKSLGTPVVRLRWLRHECLLLKKEQNKKEEAV